MQSRSFGMIVTAATALICGCASLFSCIWGFLISSGTPINVTRNGTTMPQTVPPALGYGLLCLAVIMILIPVAVGFFTLRRKPEAVDIIPPAS